MQRKKKIFLNEKMTHYCWVKLFSTKTEMQAAMQKNCMGKSHNSTLGLHNAYTRLKFISGTRFKYIPETGTIYLCKEHSGAGIATHEILHAILWANNHTKNKIQYPIVIKNMAEEERILRNFTFAVKQFYSWYWKVEKQLK